MEKTNTAIDMTYENMLDNMRERLGQVNKLAEMVIVSMISEEDYSAEVIDERVIRLAKAMGWSRAIAARARKEIKERTGF